MTPPTPGQTGTVRVRPARTDEAAALAEVAAATFVLACPPSTSPDAVAAVLRDALAPANFAAYLADPDRLLHVADDGSDLLLGYSMLVFGEPQDADAAAAISIRPTAELSKCYLRLEAHGTGAGAALMTATLEAARQRGAAGIWLGTSQVNARAQRFYDKHDFRRVGVKRFRLGDRYEDDFVFERAL